MELKQLKPTLRTSYEQKFEKLWNILFWINGLQVTNNNSRNRTKYILVAINALLHIITALHYLLAVLYGIESYLKTKDLHVYISFLSGFTTVFVSVFSSLILQYRKQKFLSVYKKLALYNDINFIKSLYKLTFTYLFLLLFVPMFTVSSISIGYNRTLAANFSVVLLFGLDNSSKMFRYGKILNFVQYLFILIFAKYFVDLMIVYFAHICKKIARKFRLLNLKLEAAMANGRILDFDDLNKFRQRHQYICQLTEDVNNLFSPLVITWLLGLTVILCFDLRVIKMKFEFFHNLFFGIKIVDEICLLILLFKVSAEINREAHFMNEKIQTSIISWTNSHLDYKQPYDLNYILFCQRLSSANIGITASGLFLLNASSFLSMCASVFTYVIVLYQTS